MPKLLHDVCAFVDLVTRGRTVEAIERFYAEDVCVFENRELARAGAKRCATYEREQLEKQPSLPTFRALKLAVNEEEQSAFIEWLIRFSDSEGRPMRLEEVSVQKWDAGKISEERFYYEGVVDEGVLWEEAARDSRPTQIDELAESTLPATPSPSKR